MKAFMRMLTLLVLPAVAQANWPGPPVTVDTGINCRFNLNVADVNACMTLKPWYTYFPYEAHFQAAAPVPSYPGWPPRMTSSMDPRWQNSGQQNQNQQLPPGLVPQQPQQPPPPPPPNGAAHGPNLSWGYYQPPAFQPVGYYAPAQFQAPSYWYGR